MTRITIKNENNEFLGWFNLDSAEWVASFCEGDAYLHGKVLIVTASKKLVINEWTNSGYDFYKFASDKNEIAEILAKSDCDNKNAKLTEILNTCEL